MNKAQAIKKDTAFYAHFCEDGLYHIFGVETGFSYTNFYDIDKAEIYAREMNENKLKQRILEIEKVKSCSVELAENPMEEHWCKIWFDFKFKHKDKTESGRKEFVSKSVNHLVEKVNKYILEDKKDYKII